MQPGNLSKCCYSVCRDSSLTATFLGKHICDISCENPENQIIGTNILRRKKITKKNIFVLQTAVFFVLCTVLGFPVQCCISVPVCGGQRAACKNTKS